VIDEMTKLSMSTPAELKGDLALMYLTIHEQLRGADYTPESTTAICATFRALLRKLSDAFGHARR
jgi:hypothetical protein